MRVDDRPAFASVSGHSDTGLDSQIDSQVRGSRAGSDNREAGLGRFHHHLGRDPAGSQDQLSLKRLADPQSPSDNLVNGIMATDVFGYEKNFLGSGHGGAMDAAGLLIQNRLSKSIIHQTRQRADFDHESALHPGQPGRKIGY